MRLLNIEPENYCHEARSILKEFSEVTEEELSRIELLRCVKDFDILIVRLNNQIDREVIDAGSRLKVIVSATTGLDHIDVDYAHQNGISVLCLKNEVAFLESVPATAELTWGLLLSVMRKLPQAYALARPDIKNRDHLRGYDISGRRLGVLGLGRIGRMIARYGNAFDMEVYAFDPFNTHSMSGVQRLENMADFLDVSDVLSIHVPLDERTRLLIGEQELAMLPEGAVLINSSRGEIVDSSALLRALEGGRLMGAALDVIPGERDVDEKTESPLVTYARNHGNLIITPHIGGASVDSMKKTEIFMAKKLRKWVMAR